MSDHSIFVSYAHENSAIAADLDRALVNAGASVWRDREKLYAGARWPKDLGEAVAGNDALVLVWSEHAAASDFVELEWCTAFALAKPILPYLIDDTPLPPALASFHAVQADDVGVDATQLIRHLEAQPRTSSTNTEQLLSALRNVDADTPDDEALHTVRNLVTESALRSTHRVPAGRRATTGAAIHRGAMIGNRFRIESLLGEGGSGEVWRAFDVKLGLDVALKFLHRTVSDLDVLRREVRAAREVHSPNLCRIYDLGETDGTEFISMEYIDGTTLAQVMRDGPMDVENAAAIASQLLSGLLAVHEAGLVHRDVKPENLMVTRTGRLVLMDLGQARWRADDAVFSVSGTPAYMAPEQLRGEHVDHRCDIFAAGIVLAELTCPEGAITLKQRRAVWQGIHEEPPRLPDTPWADVLATAVAHDAQQRFGSARDFARSLENIASRLSAKDDVNPYPGLAPFTEADTDYFFGREAEIEALWKLLNQPPRLRAVAGASGAGKSSFLRAGIVGTKPDGWATLVLTPGNDPHVALGRAVARALEGDAGAAESLVEFANPDVAVDVIRRWAHNQDGALIIVDQFEELFTQNTHESQARFIDLLARLPIEADVHVLLGMRDDFLLACHEHEPLSPVFSELTPLKALTGERLRRAIVQPALKCGFQFEDDALVDEMQAEVEGERGALPLLAFAAASLWSRRDREQRTLTRAAYEEIGGVAGALAGHADQTLQRIGKDREPLVRELFRNLATHQGTRAARDRDELLSVFSADERAEATDVLDRLIDARLLVTFEADDDRNRIQIAHESLLERWPRLAQWQTQDVEAERTRDQVRQAAKVWNDNGRSDDFLWTGDAFREFELWRDRYPGGLSTVEQQFGDAMTAIATRRSRRRSIAIAATVALAIVVAVSTTLLWQRSESARQQATTAERQARDEARRAEAARLLALAQARRERDPTEALAYTTASLEMADSQAARLYALRLLQGSPPAFELPTGGTDFARLEFSPDGRQLAAAGHSSEVRVWPDDGGPPVVLSGHSSSPQGGIRAHWISNQHLVTGLSSINTSRESYLWRLPAGEKIHTIEFGGLSLWQTGPDLLLVQTPMGDATRRLREWRLPGGEVRELGSVDTDGLQWGLFLGNGDGYVYERRASSSGGNIEVLPLPVAANDTASAYAFNEAIPGIAQDLLAYKDPPLVVTRDDSGIRRIFEFEGSQPHVLRSIPPLAGSPERLFPDRTLRWGMDLQSLQDGEARVWHLEGWSEARPLRLRRSGSWYSARATFHPNGDWLVATTHNLRRLTFWPLPAQHPHVVHGYTGDLKPLAFSPDGRWLASTWSEPGTIKVWPLSKTAQSNRARTIRIPFEYPVTNLAFDPQGRFLFLVGYRGLACIVPIDGGEPQLLDGLPADGLVYGAAVSPGGRQVATAFGYGRGVKALHVWNLDSGEHNSFDLPPGYGSNTGYEGGIQNLAFTNERTLYTAGDGGVRKWDLVRGEHETILAKPGYIAQMRASHNRKTAVVQLLPLPPPSGQGTTPPPPAAAVMLDLERGTVQALAQSLPRRRGRFDLSPDADLLVDGDQEGIIHVGRVSSKDRYLLPGHEGPISWVTISPDNRWIASTGEDNTLRLWPMLNLDEPPLHTLSRDDLIAKLKTLTNIRVERNTDNDWVVRLDEFPGWAEIPDR